MANLYANFLELWSLAYLGDLSKYMYKANLYVVIFWVMLLLPLIVWFLYYKVIDNIKLANIKSWAIILVVVLLVTGVFTYVFSYNGVIDYLYAHKIKKYNIGYGDIFYLSLIAALWSAIFSVIYSWVLKNFSKATRNIPF